MVDLEPFLEAPFEEASNVSFELLLLAGAALLALVSIVGRGPVTAAIVAIYLLAVPGYVAFRIRAWDGPDENESEGEDTDGTD